MKSSRLTLALVLAALAVLVVPAAAQALPRGFFGIVPQTTLEPGDFSRMRAGGVDTVRVPVSWSATKPKAKTAG